MENPYKRLEMNDPKARYFIILGGQDRDSQVLGTRSGFATYEDAKHFEDSIASCWNPFIVQRYNDETHKAMSDLIEEASDITSCDVQCVDGMNMVALVGECSIEDLQRKIDAVKTFI